MALVDVISSLASDRAVQVVRRLSGSFNSDGIWAPGASQTLTFPSVVIEPATGMQRVIGGADMRSDEQGQQTADVRAIYSALELKSRTPQTEPDQVLFDGAVWVVVRVEKWALNAQVIYRAMVTRETRGAS